MGLVMFYGFHSFCILIVICELLAVNHGNLELDLFSKSVLDAFIEFLCTTEFFTIFLCLLLLFACTMYDLHNK